MSSSVPTLVQRQVARVSRRLFFQTLLDCLIWCWAGALVLSAVWFLLQPLLLTSPPGWLRWTVAGGSVGAGAILAVVLAVVKAPSRLAAALSLPGRAVTNERMEPNVSKINPGDWGKVGPGWLARPLLSPRRKVRRPEAGFTSSSGGVRAPSVTRIQGLSGEE